MGGVIWEPLAVALVLGLLISAGIYFIFLWPAREPTDDEPADGDPAAK